MSAQTSSCPVDGATTSTSRADGDLAAGSAVCESEPPAWLPSIFDYLDVRTWLRACFESGRAHTRHFSHRWLARRMGRSTGYLSNIMAGRRRILDAAELADALKLDPESRCYLEDLVALDGCDDGPRRRVLLRRLTSRHRRGRSRRLDASWYAYLSEWHFVAIREMAGLPGFRADPAWIAERLVSPVPLDQIADCLTVLENLELIRIDGGRAIRGEPIGEAVTFGHEVRSAAAAQFHCQVLTLAGQSIDRVDRALRHLNAKTISIRADRVPALKARINALLEEFVDDPVEERPDAVYQLEVALFPLALGGSE